MEGIKKMSDGNLTPQEIAQIFAEDELPQSNDILSSNEIDNLLTVLDKVDEEKDIKLLNEKEINKLLSCLLKERINSLKRTNSLAGNERSEFPAYYSKRENMLKAVAASDMNCFSVSLVKIIIDGVEKRLYKVIKLPECIEDIKLK